MPALRCPSALAVVAAGLLLGSFAAAEPAPPPIPVDPLPLRALLAARDFDALEARFAAARAARDTHELTALLWAIERMTAEEHLGLERWVSERPPSIPARLALAQRELGRARDARGTGYARTVGSDARHAMRERLERSLALAAEVAGRDPRWPDAYRIQIECAQLLGDRALARRAFEAGLAVDPAHYGIWSKYQQLLSRRWGGSYEAQEEIARAAQAHAAANPRLRKLLGTSHADRALDLWSAGRHAEALAAYDRALAHGDDGWRRADRALVRSALGDRAGARAEIEAGLAIDPYVAKLHAASARLAMAERDFPAMVAPAARALELQPGDAELRDLHEWAVWAAAHRHEAARELERNPVQRLLRRHGRLAYWHALDAAIVATLLGIGWYAWRARARRRLAREAAATAVTRTPVAARPPEPRRLSIVDRLPRTGVLMVRAYVWFEVVHHVLVYSEAIRPGADLRVVGADVAISGAALAGALGFAHGIRLGRPWPWKLWALGFPIWNQVLQLEFRGFTWAQWPVWGFLHLELLPIYTALFLYGFRCERLWAGGLPGPGWAPARRASAPTPAPPARG